MEPFSLRAGERTRQARAAGRPFRHRLGSGLFFLALPLLAGLLPLRSGEPVTLPTGQRPHVVLILADDLGYGDPRCFHPDSKIATPHIDRLGAEGMRFTDAHAAGSVCVPSRYGLLSGRLPIRTWKSEGARLQSRNGHPVLHFPAPMIQSEPQRMNLARLMKRNGYTTACIGKWHQGMSSTARADGTLQTSPVDAGFDFFFGFDAPEQGPYAFIENHRFAVAPTIQIENHPGLDVTNPETQGQHWRKGAAAANWKFEDVLPTLAARAEEWLVKQTTQAETRPFFLYYPIPAPHAPWMAADEFRGKSDAGQYGDYVMTVDAMIGRLMTALETFKLKENTLVFFSSDNGPVWYEQDVARFQHRASGPWRGRKGDLHEGGHRVPFLVRWPGHIKAGTVCEELICFTDLMATFAAILGERLPREALRDSYDFSRVLGGEQPAQPIRPWLIHANYGSYSLALRAGDWKLILPEWIYAVKDGVITPDHVVTSGGKGPRGQFELYHLRDDPAETRNVFAQQPAKAAELFEILKREIASNPTL